MNTLRSPITLTILGHPASRILRRMEEKTAIELSGCWIWNGYLRNSYGSISINNRNEYLHHLSFQLFNGPIGVDVVVRHSCDRPACWNPDHLLSGTQLDNIDDMNMRGRGVSPPTKCGEEHPKSTLSDLDIEEIRRIGGRNQRVTAARFGVATAAGYTVNGHFNNMRGHLKSLGLVEYVSGKSKAADLLFPNQR